MIKYFCDRCGVEMTKEKRHGFVSVNTRDKACLLYTSPSPRDS